MKRPQKGSTIQQYAYATRKLGGQGSSKKEIALLSGYSMSVANNAFNKIEKTDGYQNAIQVLAGESNNMLLAVLAEFKVRGLKGFSNKDLNAALNAISGAWTKIDDKRSPDRSKDPTENPLRGVFQRRVETQTVAFETIPKEAPIHTEAKVIQEANPDLDF